MKVLMRPLCNLCPPGRGFRVALPSPKVYLRNRNSCNEMLAKNKYREHGFSGEYFVLH